MAGWQAVDLDRPAISSPEGDRKCDEVNNEIKYAWPGRQAGKVVSDARNKKTGRAESVCLWTIGVKKKATAVRPRPRPRKMKSGLLSIARPLLLGFLLGPMLAILLPLLLLLLFVGGFAV